MHKNSDGQKKHHICRHFKTSFCQKAILWKGFYRHNMSSSSSFVSKGRDEALRNGEKKIITHKLSTIKVSIWQHDFLICSSRMSHWRGEGSLCLRAGQRLTRWRMLQGSGGRGWKEINPKSIPLDLRAECDMWPQGRMSLPLSRIMSLQNCTRH